MSYPSDRADSLEEFVRKRYDLPANAYHVYVALRWLERQQKGLCKPVIALYRTISSTARIDLKQVSPALIELRAKGLCVVDTGSDIKADKRATSIQRRTLDEIKVATTVGEDVCHRLAQALNDRGFLFTGKLIKPVWTVGQTGRVSSSKPNIQGLPGDKRAVGLRAGLQEGQVLVYADIKGADPAVIKHLIGIPAARDLYQEFMAATGADKPSAKREVNAIAYCRNTLARFNFWPTPAKAALGDYVKKIDDYKRELLTEARKKRRVTTVAGRPIAAPSAMRLHAGKVLCWKIQGTIADIVNAAALRLLATPEAGAVVPLHDGFYAVVPSSLAPAVTETVRDEARKIGLALEVAEKEKYGK